MKNQRFTQNRFLIISFIAFTVLVSSMFNVGTTHAFERIPTAGIAINGKMVNGIDPIKIGGYYYLPLTELAKILSYNDIRFESNTKTYEMTDGSTTVRTTMGGTQARRGDEYINIHPPRWINDTAYISLGAGGALFNAFIYFKPENGSIQVEKPAHRYRVQAGDSLWKIAESHHISVQALKNANNLTSNLIYSGQILKLPSGEEGKEMEPIKEKKPVKNNNPAPSQTIATNILNEAQQYIGAGYKFGATLNEAPTLFDCSSFTQFVFGNNGIELPRNSRQQSAVGTSVTNLKAGDLIFFTNRDLYSDGRVGHVGIYMGNGDMIHASSSRGVHIATNFLNIGYWKDNYLFAKRIIE
ncbi:NlpC/P60 family protein [Evansella sp. AB-P1]|uniref:NlpC/P60 family protein n=1 Tax=Evansella sp. AB-P1 TaxID=3037653 RepID=UPI00241E395B|nr:NlpC/P60 family protein [Evansella sp. AB-P1]MDG5789952.1 NlpC/P60 family protein [Evansella sp. AB-P1]